MFLEDTIFDGTKETSALRREEKGVVLIITLIITLTILILIIPFLSKLSGQYRATDRSFKSYAALNLAEAGVEQALWELNDGNISNWEGTSDERTLTLSSIQAANGSIVGDVVITVSELNEDNPVILSTGKVPFRNSDTVDRTIRAVVEMDSEVLFGLALFASDGINITGKSQVDAYDSREGDYKGQNKGLATAIATNATHFGAITLEDKAELTGNAQIGHEGDPDDILVLDKAKINGNKQALHEPTLIPPIEAPQGLPWRGEINKDSGKKIEITESGEYSSITLDKGATLTISEDVVVYISGPFNLEKGSKFIIEDGVHVQLYLGHSFYMEKGSKFNKKFDKPTNLQIWGVETFNGDFIAEGGEEEGQEEGDGNNGNGQEGGGGFIMDSNNAFCGAVYLPEGNMEINGNMKYYGSIVAKTILIDANAKVHYDIALSAIDTPYSSIVYKVISWQEKLHP